MKKLLICSVVLLSFAMGTAAYAQNNSGEQNHIEVSTRVEEQVTPDIIYLNIVINEATSNKTVLEAKEREMIKTLQKLGINVEENLTVNDMGSDLKKYFLKKDNIVANKSYTLKLADAKEVAAVFDALNGINISDVSMTKCAISPELEQQVKNRLLVAAAKKAKENATILAEAVGSKAGSAIYIQNYYTFSQPVMAKAMTRGLMYAASNEEADALPSLEVSKTTISVSVLCRFALLQ